MDGIKPKPMYQSGRKGGGAWMGIDVLLIVEHLWVKERDTIVFEVS